MQEVTLNYKVLNPTGFLHCMVPQDVFSVVLQEVNSIIDTNFNNGIKSNSYLVGVIEKEYYLYNSANILNKFFKQIVPKYWDFNGNPENAKKLYQLSKTNNTSVLWVNFQKKYEYNPLHNHSGDLSFVLYIKIPYNIDDELKMPHVKDATCKKPPLFSFIYPSFPPEPVPFVNNLDLVKSYELYLNKEDEGMLILFPSWLQHQVTPFYTSDEYRISVAGNLVSVNND
jgi:hypothetical protein